MTITTKSGISVQLTPQQCDVISSILESGSIHLPLYEDFLFDLAGLFHMEYHRARFDNLKNGEKVRSLDDFGGDF